MNVAKTSQTLSQIVPPKKIVSVKRLFQKGFAYSLDTYQSVANSGRQIVGNLPSDILKLILTSGCDKKVKIQQVQGAFIDAVNSLSGTEQLRISAAQKRLKNLAQLPNVKKFFMDNGFLPPISIDSQIQPQLKLASNILQSATANIFPQGTQVKISYLASGSFGNVYKVAFVKDKKHVCAPLALKIFKRDDEFVQFERIASKTKNKLFVGMNEKERKLLPFAFKQMGEEEIEAILKEHKLYHGVYPEANVIQYIKKSVGHKLKDKDDLLLPDMFILGNSPFCIGRFSDFTDKPTRFFDFEQFGLKADDLHNSNTVCGRIIDFGGIKHSRKSLDLYDKTVMKYFKKIVSKNPEEQDRLLGQYGKLLPTISDLTLKEKINNGIEMAMDYILRNYYKNRN